jgi:hypothetical protein
VRKERRNTFRETLPPEPLSSSEKTVFLIRLPNGERVKRAFNSSDSIDKIYEFAATLDPLNEDATTPSEWGGEAELENLPWGFHIVEAFPRRIIKNSQSSISEAGLSNGGNLIVEI